MFCEGAIIRIFFNKPSPYITEGDLLALSFRSSSVTAAARRAMHENSDRLQHRFRHVVISVNVSDHITKLQKRPGFPVIAGIGET